jgi:hypothetical protein
MLVHLMRVLLVRVLLVRVLATPPLPRTSTTIHARARGHGCLVLAIRQRHFEGFTGAVLP